MLPHWWPRLCMVIVVPPRRHYIGDPDFVWWSLFHHVVTTLVTFYLFPRVLGHVDPLDRPRALLDNGLCSTSLGLDFFQPATRPAPLSLLSIGLSNLPGPTLFGLSSTRPATSLFGLSSSRPATSLFGPSSTRPATSRFGLRRTRPATSLFCLSSTRSTTSSTQPQLGASSHSAPDPACNAHSSRDAARGSRYCTLFFCLSPSTLVFFFVYCSLLCLHFVSFFFIQTHWRGSIVVFLPRTLQLLYFCTFLFYLHRTQYNFHRQRILIHARTFFHVRLAQAPEQSTWLFLSLHRLPAFLLVATLFFSTNKSYFSTSSGLTCCHRCIGTGSATLHEGRADRSDKGLGSRLSLTLPHFDPTKIFYPSTKKTIPKKTESSADLFFGN